MPLKIDKNQQLLLGAILVLVFLAVAFYAYTSYQDNTAGGGSGAADLCQRVSNPLPDGVGCLTVGGGQYVTLSPADLSRSGMALTANANLNVIKSFPATTSNKNCYTEAACQAECSGDDSCVLYTYDASKQTSRPDASCSTDDCCPTPGAVCTTYSGDLSAATFGLNRDTSYVTIGIPGDKLQ